MRPVAAALLAAGLMPLAAQAQVHAPADDREIERLIRGAYTSYVAADATPRALLPLSDRLKAAEAECRALQKKIEAGAGEDTAFGECSEDYDLLCQCQDPFGRAWPSSAIAITHPDPLRAEAAVAFPPMDGEKGDALPDLKWLFVKTAKGWAVDDFWEVAQAAEGGQGSYRARLVASIAKMRARLGLPA